MSSVILVQFKTIYIDVQNTTEFNENNSQHRELFFMSKEQIKETLSQARGFSDHLSFALYHDVNDHPDINYIFDLAAELGFRFDVRVSSMKFIEHIEDNISNNAISMVSLCVASLEEKGCLKEKKNIDLLLDAMRQLSSHNIQVLVDLPSKEPQHYNENTLSFISALGLDLNNKLWQKGFQVSVEDHIMIRCCETIDNGEELSQKKIGRCYGSVTMLGIMGNGNVIPCNHANGQKIIFGNLFEEALSDVLNKEPYLSISDGFYKNELVHPVCQHCPKPRKRF